ncbi:universal stress protein [Saccharopolyspora phatthalungensis]|uniref:Nucleotide-binding universal stress UspA family protein n=1 Tax=Saccharopolyspora phatthalungensis TaxID=664693 RepID=A0A840Q809_9PSEU|nr:universal stress protein [Saccharopolyspora phatthalungensis]MBB5155990.1 nucleotide-binding universal stress UspA family protein [Saccharopolyspora phatthalungensis]
MESRGRVVVGVDGSELSLTAVRWAAGEADLRPAKQLHVVMASGDPMWDDEAWEILRPVVDQIAGDHPSLEVS